MSQVGSQTIFNDSSTADSATLVAGGGYYGASGGILFNGASTGGTARVERFSRRLRELAVWLPGY